MQCFLHTLLLVHCNVSFVIRFQPHIHSLLISYFFRISKTNIVFKNPIFHQTCLTEEKSLCCNLHEISFATNISDLETIKKYRHTTMIIKTLNKHNILINAYRPTCNMIQMLIN